MGVGRVRAPAQGVDDPDIEAGQGLEGVFRQAHHVAGIGDVAEPVAHRAQAAVVLVEGDHRDGAGGAVHGPGLAMGRDQHRVGDAGIAPLPLEDIAEPAAHGGEGGPVHVAGDARPLPDEEGPDVVDPVGLVGVVVGQQEGVEAPGAGLGGLPAQVGRGVHQDGRGLGRVGRRATDQEGTAGAEVARVGGIALPPVAVRPGHAAGGAAAEDGELQGPAHGRGIRSKRAKKASSQRASASCGVQPRTVARPASTAGRKAGSLRRPRCGTGAR